jgi:hypothetical protein
MESNTIYILQARMVFQHQDTKALEKFLGVKATSSKFNPFNSNIYGLKFSKKMGMTYRDYYKMLPLDHLIRCDLEGQNNEVLTLLEEDITAVSLPKNLTDLPNMKKNKKADEIRMMSYSIAMNFNGLQDRYTPLKQSKKKNQKIAASNNIWYHPNYPYENYSEHLWAVHLNKTEYKPYEKTSNDQYKMKLKNKMENTEINNGINYPCVFNQLSSFQFNYFDWDPFHCFKNIISYFLDLMKNKRKIKADCRKLCIAQKVHPLLWSESSIPQWVLSDDDMLLLDSIVGSVLIPKGVKCTDYHITYPIRHTSYLTGYSSIVVFVTYIKFLLSFHSAASSSMGSPYISFFCQFASDLVEILNPIIVKEDVKTLCSKVIETMTIYDFLFPDSEKSFAFMQLLDIVHFLGIGGPIRSQWCLFGERALGQIGKTVNSGGVNYLKNLFEKHVAHEIHVSSTDDLTHSSYAYYNNMENDNFSMYLIQHDTVAAESNKIEAIFKNDIEYRNARLDQLIESAVGFLLVQEIDNLIIRSPLYRVYSTFIYYYKQKKKVDQTFFQWLVFTVHQKKQIAENNNNYNLADNVLDVTVIVDLAHKKGVIFEEDYSGILTDLYLLINEKKIEIYTRAVIKGNKYFFYYY